MKSSSIRGHLESRWRIFLILICLVINACGDDGPWREQCERITPESTPAFTSLTWGTGTALFNDATQTYAFHHIHDLIDTESYYDGLPGGGVAIEDFDKDGDYDLVISGGDAPVGYFLNEGPNGFVECAKPAGLTVTSDLSIGISAADFDNDGDRDILILNHGPNTLLENQGDGSFVDITPGSGLTGDFRSSGASWADLDEDGLLDLFIANLADEFSIPPAGELIGARSQLFKNLGNGFFEEMSESFPSGQLPIGSSYIAPMIDLDGDRHQDVVLTQEFGGFLQRNQIYQNLGPSSEQEWPEWTNQSFAANIGYPSHVMGFAIFDLNQDALPDLYMTNLLDSAKAQEFMHLNKGEFVFEDITESYNVNGLVRSTETGLYRTSSWAALNLDYDNDGDDDLYTVYGAHAPRDQEADASCEISVPTCPNQPNALYNNSANSQFELLSGTGTEDQGLGRGAAAADMNQDGCLDIVSVNQSQPSRLLFNKCSNSHYSVRIELEGTVSNRDAVGSILIIESGTVTQTKFITAGATSLHSAQPFGVHIGTGQAAHIDRLTVKWPNGIDEQFENIAASSDGSARYVIVEGSARVSPYVPPSTEPEAIP